MNIKFETNLGDIELELFPDRAPNTVKNFMELATGEKKWTHPDTGEEQTGPLYNDTIFHRVIPDFMIQGGDPKGTGTGGPGYQFDCEVHDDDDFSQPGMLAMANAGPNTNGSQFFITVGATPWLKKNHTIFGKVTSGQDVVERISLVDKGAQDRPREDVVLKQVTLL